MIHWVNARLLRMLQEALSNECVNTLDELISYYLNQMHYLQNFGIKKCPKGIALRKFLFCEMNLTPELSTCIDKSIEIARQKSPNLFNKMNIHECSTKDNFQDLKSRGIIPQEVHGLIFFVNLPKDLEECKQEVTVFMNLLKELSRSSRCPGVTIADLGENTSSFKHLVESFTHFFNDFSGYRLKGRKLNTFRLWQLERSGDRFENMTEMMKCSYLLSLELEEFLYSVND